MLSTSDRTERTTWGLFPAAALRLPAQYLGIALIIATLLAGLVASLAGTRLPSAVINILATAAFVAIMLSVVFTIVSPVDRSAPLSLGAPVRGPWQVINSPTSRVPSHGTHAYGQAYAVDLAYAPPDVDRPVFGQAGGHFLDSARFPAFGQPVIAVAEAVVVRAHDGQRDHRSRSSWPAFLYLMIIESIVRSIGPPRWVIGNHLVLRLADGSHVLYAHLKRGSQRVGVGDRVRVGLQLAECGNSGNSTEPHLHVQRQDRPGVLLATGLPWTIDGDELPPNGSILDGPTAS
ncbi:M23 family metallopeptidase [Microlunatus speluncae]|uniref:M23 family metallopeptidase n=1 Tax=Microlunatus speluncae TaxID=2594267 RepID=UPI00126649A2|nr:M23 family metallopeptidase [Microlunatus speluncae]